MKTKDGMTTCRQDKSFYENLCDALGENIRMAFQASCDEVSEIVKSDEPDDVKADQLVALLKQTEKDVFEEMEGDADWVVDWVENEFDPDDIFQPPALHRWANENGY